MKHSLPVAAAALALVLSATVARTQDNGAATGSRPVPEIAYESVPDFLALPPDIHFGEVAGIAVNSAKHVFILSRGGTKGPAYGAAAAQLLEFGPDGKFLREIGKGLYAWSYAHVVRVDSQDNIWVMDKGSDMVVKFRPDGRVAMVWGRKTEASDDTAEPWKHPMPPLPPVQGQFRQVTDVAWDKAGNAYISDGYINSRVAKIDKDGNWVASFGSYGTEAGQFRTLHSIASDAEDRIYVADRGNARIQVMDTAGRIERIIKIDVPFDYEKARAIIRGKPARDRDPKAPDLFTPGAPWALCITPAPNQVLYVADAFPGRIYKLSLDGKVLGVLGETGKQLKQFGWIHEIACPSENELYVGELLNWRPQKLVLHP
ncbi:peptidyl-alpha-hydroxyglycine alpha-amidating lyase family protein [uncultured Methylobacterium sp.]|uniref:peptidyl-alpha-hydroxyglycine alpha-amidating lyase family protein n=1 Tax=uncultured Methylobacterium sp. TaxID=157278 RepID=UPI0035CBCD2F